MNGPVFFCNTFLAFMSSLKSVNPHWSHHKEKKTKSLGGNVGMRFHDLGLDISFLNKTPKAQTIKDKNR